MTKIRTIGLVLIATGIVALAGVGLYRAGVEQGIHHATAPAAAPRTSGEAATKAGDVDPATGKKILYWHDPMVPGQKFDKPGKSPFMDMQLVPVYAGEGSDDAGGVTISPRVQQNLGIRTAEVTRGTLAPRIEARKRRSATYCWRAATRSTCACRRCSSKPRRPALGRSSRS